VSPPAFREPSRRQVKSAERLCFTLPALRIACFTLLATHAGADGAQTSEKDVRCQEGTAAEHPAGADRRLLSWLGGSAASRF